MSFAELADESKDPMRSTCEEKDYTVNKIASPIIKIHVRQVD